MTGLFGQTGTLDLLKVDSMDEERVVDRSWLLIFWSLGTLPYLTSGVDRLLHPPSAEAVSARPNAHPECNQKVTASGHKAVTAVKP